MITIAKVIEVNSEYTVVETARKSACDGCHKNADGNECTICTIMGPNRTIRAHAVNKVGAVVGDNVEISSSSSRILFYALLVFIVPVVCGLAAYFITRHFGAADVVVYSSVVGGFILPFIPIGIYSSVVVKKRNDIVIKRIL
jgi:positive regulator of sigma E activity